MTNKELLQKRIDELCKELGIAESPYTDKTTEKQLNAIIDELEAKLPDEGDEHDESDESHDGSDQEAPGPDDTSGPQTAPPTDSDGQAPAENEVLAIASELPEGATLTDDDNVPEVQSNAEGDLKVKALKTFQALSHGKTVIVTKGETAYLEEQAAMDAVDAGAAGFLATIK
ncbi:hypothetical protein KW507_22065 [Vibrio fluvialis]|nr:hypothetical protein [Vibrio fluvialis]MBY7942223.1 hypothetical protein [Vibrio fluvialis]MBY8169340.1 hypothetical protein [Vibrio fluvialis]MBY8291117.1 hypothetical protein [Vibrio fluvialis]